MYIREIRNPHTFQDLCRKLFAAEYQDFQEVDDAGGDRGNDGYIPSEQRLFAIYCPTKVPTQQKYFRRKILSDLKKAVRLRDEFGYQLKEWIFVTPAPLPEDIQRYLRQKAEDALLQGISWTESKLSELFQRHKHLHAIFPDLAILDLREEIWKACDSTVSTIKSELTLADEYKQRLADEKVRAYDRRLAAARAQIDEGRFETALNSLQEIVSDLKRDSEVNVPSLFFRAYNNIAACELELDQFREAATHFKEAHVYFPDDQKAIANLALARMLEGDLEAAEQTINNGLETDPNDRLTIEVKANILLMSRKFDELRAFANHQGDDEIKKYLSALCAFWEGDVESSLSPLQELADDFPTNTKYLNLAAEAIFLWQRDHLRRSCILPWLVPSDVWEVLHKGEAFLSAAIDIERNRETPHKLATSLVTRSAIRLMLYRPEDALADCADALKINSSEQAAIINKGKAELFLGRYDEAVRTLRTCLELGGEFRSDTLRALCVGLLNAGETQEAGDLALEEIGSDVRREDLDLVEFAVLALDRRQDFDKADELVQKVRRILPDLPHTLRIEASHCRKKGRDRPAEDLLRQALDHSSGIDRYSVAIDLSSLLWDRQEWEECAELLLPYLNEEHDNLISRRYVDCLYNLNRFSEAIDLIRKLSNGKKPGEFFGQVEAACQESLGNLRAAANCYLDLYQHLPNRIEFLVRYGICLGRLGEGETAVKSFNQVRDKVRSGPDLLALSHGYLSIGEFQIALDLAYQALKKSPNDPNVHAAYVMLFLRREKANGADPSLEQVEAFQETLEKFNDRFPKETVLEKVAVDSQLTQITERLDRVHEFTTEIQQQYQKGFLPISTASVLSKHSLLEIWSSFGNMPDTGIRVSLGTNEEQAEERECITSASEVVVDLLALFTLALTGQLELPPRKFTTIHVHQSVLDELLTSIDRESLSAGQGYMTVGKHGDNYVRYEVTPEEIQNRLSFLHSLKDFVSGQCQVSGLLKEPTAIEKSLIKMLGKASGYSALLAKQRAVALLSDDALMRVLIKNKMGVEAFSSQMMFTFASENGLIDLNEFCQIRLSLLRSRYFYVSVNAKFLQYCIEQSGYQANQDLNLVLDEIGKAETSISSLVHVLSDFLKDLWVEPVPPVTKSLLLQKVLSSATAHHSALEVVPVLRRELKGKMQLLLYHYFVDLEQQINLWIQHNRLVVTP